MTYLEKGTFLKLFNRGGYVLDFSTQSFDAFTKNSVGVEVCYKYGMSKGKSLAAYLDDASEAEVIVLLSNLLSYYETQYDQFDAETSDTIQTPSYGPNYRKLYHDCKRILDKYKASNPNQELAKAVEGSFSSEYISQQINLMLDNQEKYPAESIGKAKELVESCCRTILTKRGVWVDPHWSFQQLVNQVFDILEVKPERVDDSSPIAKSLKQLYGSLKGMVVPIAEIRNAFGTGHGRVADFVGLDSRHAKLYVGMCVTLVLFLWETHEAQV